MRNRVLLAAFVAAGCSGAVGSNDNNESARGATNTNDKLATESLERLKLDTGATWELAVSAEKHRPAILIGKSTPMLNGGRTAREATFAFLTQYPGIARVVDAERDLVSTRTERDELGMTHARFQQYKGGLKVEGGELVSHFNREGALTALTTSYASNLERLSLDPAFDAARAVSLALTDLRVELPSFDESALVEAPSAELVVLADPGKDVVLAYRVRLHGGGYDTTKMEYAVDAKTGAILSKYDDIQTVAGSGLGVLGDTKQLQVTQNGANYTLLDTSRTPNGIRTYSANNGTALPGALVSSASATSFDAAAAAGKGAAVDAHFYAGVVYDYFKAKHARNGIDGNNGAIVSTVHFQTRYANAFWDGRQMAYGDGDGTRFRAFSASLDVIGHELTHGVITNTSNLRYQNQSGALNEALADIFGAFVEHAYKPDAKANWLLGEALSLTGASFRDMIHPNANQQPAHQSQYVQTTQDNGGVHINSGIINNAMYLMTLGGTNDVSKVKVAAGIDWDKSAKVWYRAMVNYYQSTTDFAGAARGTMMAANDLALTDNEKAIVECAWIATGILPGACKTITAPGPTPPPAVDGGAPDAASPPTQPPTTPGGDAGSAPAPGTGTSGPSPSSPADDSTSNGATDSADDDDSTVVSGGPAKPRKPLTAKSTAAGCSASPMLPGGTAPMAALVAGVLSAFAARRRRRG